MKNRTYSLRSLFLLLQASLLVACGVSKDTTMSRGMQNLTARFNYIYNANLILDRYEQQLYEDYKDNYNEILPVYTAPEKFDFSNTRPSPVNEQDLDRIIDKARTIIADKSFSNYIDNSYLLLGRAYYYKTNYFIAEEYFDYTAKAYSANQDVRISALNWKARSLMQLENLNAAALILDTVYNNLSSLKSGQADPAATIAQMYIYRERYTDAIELLTSAVDKTTVKRNRIRWTYILGQLYERQKDYKQALAHYMTVQRSNAAFELYFHANLSRIKLTGLLNGEKINRTKQLSALLRDDKNLDYTDQIYFQIAESNAEENDFTGAEKYYNLSLRSSTDNKLQKGLSYLRLADLNFREFRNFLKAKLYYDSTVNTLPKSYPGYNLILKKSQNLEYISKRYDAIAYQDTLQLLATLPQEERLLRIKRLTASIAMQEQNTGSFKDDAFAGANRAINTNTTSSTFYFANTAAMSRGITDFNIRWGTRKLEDDWRQSVKSSIQATTEKVARLDTTGINAPQGQQAISQQPDTSVNKYLANIPDTPSKLNASNQQIIDAYYEMANFYQQELEDQAEALRIYQIILARFPQNNRLAPIYYSLYLGYKDSAPESSLKYKNLILEQFAGSIYAKTILDPQYSAKKSEAEALVLRAYNDVFDKYEQKRYMEVIPAVDRTIKTYPSDPVDPQLAYLKAIAIGRTKQADSLVYAFNDIISKYPEDQLIVPLVKEHLNYINAHWDEFSKRKVALPDFDQNEPRFSVTDPVPENIQAPPVVPEKVIQPSVSAPANNPVAAVQLPEPKPVAPPVKAVPEKAVPAENIFSTELSTVYYYVIDVEDASLTLSSSRFGIGQFNRGNYQGAGLRHQLTEFDNDQLIYVGNFSSFAEAKSYADGINPRLKDIMKVPAGTYSSFIISKENFLKLQNKELLNKYLDFYKNNYQKNE